MMQLTILIVDDNPEILDLVTQILAHDYHILSKTSAQEAIHLLENTSVQLIISDVMMPEMNGFEFCSRLKSDPVYCHIPIILLTAKNTLMSRIEGLELGADAYIDKPFSPKHLKVQVENLITNRNIIKEYFANSPLTHIKPATVRKSDELFLEQLDDCILQYLDNPCLDGDLLAEKLYMSRTTLYRKVKMISKLTIHEMINLARLKKAAQLLAEGNHRVFEVSHITGFSSPSHFIRTFDKHFGMSPKAFMKNQNPDSPSTDI